VLKTLEAKGVVAIEQRRRVRGNAEISPAFAKRIHERPTLTPDQQHALSVINEMQQRASGEVVVLDGVTGSGKTEVYLCAIEEELARGRNAIVLVPEISLTPQTVARFRGRFGDTVAVLHSRLSQGERFDQWDLIRTGSVRVVVGARSALFAPLANVGMIIVDEEHEGSYKQDQAPRYVTRDVAQWMAEKNGATLILGSATPSIEALEKTKSNPNWHHVIMASRANGRPLPSISVVDMAREFGGGNRKMFSKALQTALLEVLDKGQKAVLLLNQRGFAQFLLCRDCGFVPECESCSTSLTYHEQGNRLICHHCGYETQAPVTCPECGSPYLKRFGAGTQRVEAELRALLQDRPCEIVRMDADTTSHKGDHQRLLEQFARAEQAVLLGTQMIAKGLDFDDVTLVGVINADTMLNLPDFRSAERTFDLIEQVAGRSGRAQLSGRVFVQTYNAKNFAISAAAHYDRNAFLEEELTLRKNLHYPPYVRMANVLIWGEAESEVIGVAQQLFFDLNGLAKKHDAASIQVFPPTPCVLSRLKKNFRYHILVKAQPDVEIAEFCRDYFRARKPHKTVNVSIDIDPVSVL
jgi:primosomal protein N' (replication factor Y)